VRTGCRRECKAIHAEAFSVAAPDNKLNGPDSRLPLAQMLDKV